MSFGRLAVDWEERINFNRMRKERLEKAQKALKNHGLEAALLLRGDNQRYAAHNTGTLRNQQPGVRYVFLPAEGTPTLFEHGMWFSYFKNNCPWLEVKRAVVTAGGGGAAAAFPQPAFEKQLKAFAEQIKEEMKLHGIKSETLGVDLYNRPLIQALENAGIKVSMEGGAALMEARTFKTKDEIECLRMIASMVEAGWGKVKEMIRPGVTENQLKAEFLRELWLLGADFAGIADIYSGPRTHANIVVSSDRIIRAGDIIIMHACNNSYMGYRACYYRTFVCGRANQAQKDAYQTCKDYLYSALKLVKPGTTTKELAEKFPKAEEFGYPDEASAIWLQWGHGIGLSLDEPPHVTRLWSLDYPETLKAGMTLALETWWPVKENDPTYPYGQSIRLEEVVAITENGYDLLTRWPIDEITECTF